MNIQLRDILEVLEDVTHAGDESTPVSGLTHDSRQVRPGFLFVAVPGETSDGHDYIPQAIEAGATAVLAQQLPLVQPSKVPWLTVRDTRAVLGKVASVVYGRPTSKMTLVGITGTNGKTTLTFLLEAILKAADARPGVIGTISYRWAGRDYSASHTTPEASDLQRMFAEMAFGGVTHGLLEVSSHGLHRGRLEGCDFDIGVFTNLTQDHLDYHGTLEEYYQAKNILFTKLLPLCQSKRPVAIVNLDDRYGRRLAQEISGMPVIGYGTGSACDVRPATVSMNADGISGTVTTPSGIFSIRSRLTGSFNLLNILAAVAVAQRLSVPEKAVFDGIDSVHLVPGRLERVHSSNATIFVDYAHTPNALKNVLEALHSIRSGRLITIMGCGGDRDKTKRPLMGVEAARGSNFVVITSDNPRSENPLDILLQIEKGVMEEGFSRITEEINGAPLKSDSYVIIPDRRQAISWMIKRLREDDILLVAGKGHETYQEIGCVRYPFDDREVVREELAKLKKSSGTLREVI